MCLHDFLESGVTGKTDVQCQFFSIFQLIKMEKTNERKKESCFDAKLYKMRIYSIMRLIEAKFYWRSGDRFRQLPLFQISVRKAGMKSDIWKEKEKKNG